MPERMSARVSTALVVPEVIGIGAKRTTCTRTLEVAGLLLALPLYVAVML
jgi:hypothetical protein